MVRNEMMVSDDDFKLWWKALCSFDGLANSLFQMIKFFTVIYGLALYSSLTE